MVKNQPASGDAGSVPGSRRSPGVGNGHPFQYSCVRESLDERSLAGYSDRIAKSWMQLSVHAVISYMCGVLCFSSGDIKITFLQAEIWL